MRRGSPAPEPFSDERVWFARPQEVRSQWRRFLGPLSLLRFHKLGGNVTCGGALEVDFKETAVCGQIISTGKKIELLFCLFFCLFFLFAHFLITFTSLMEMINQYQQEKVIHSIKMR